MKLPGRSHYRPGGEICGNAPAPIVHGPAPTQHGARFGEAERYEPLRTQHCARSTGQSVVGGGWPRSGSMTMTSTELLPAAVLTGKEVVYIRQSTQAQVQSNLENRPWCG